MPKAGDKMYLYHIEDGKMVMDEALHTTHHKQARAKLGLPKPRYVAGTFVPLTPEEIARYEAHHDVKFHNQPRKPLPAFTDPPGWAEKRAANAAARAKAEVK
jgi:hypothetical protein